MATSATEPGMAELLTAEDLKTIRAAGTLLRRLQEDGTKCALRSVGAHADALYIGRFVEACDLAENALFNVLNTASSYFQSSAARSAIKEWRA